MAGRLDNKERWSAEVTLLAADTTKTLLATPTGTRKTIVVTHVVAHCLVSAAQAVDIKIGSVNVRRLAASEAVGSESFLGPMDYGLIGQAASAMTIVPAAAGPSWHVVAEGYYDS
jgi:hypothetical protein